MVRKKAFFLTSVSCPLLARLQIHRSILVQYGTLLKWLWCPHDSSHVCVRVCVNLRYTTHSRMHVRQSDFPSPQCNKWSPLQAEHKVPAYAGVHPPDGSLPASDALTNRQLLRAGCTS